MSVILQDSNPPFKKHRFTGGNTLIALLALMVLQLSVIHALAQDSLLLSQKNQQNGEDRKQQLENIPYTVRVDDLKILTSGSMDGEWNDNINLSHNAPESDFLLRPKVDTDVYWPVTDINILKFSLGLGYDKYFQYSANDNFIVSPGSELSWDLIMNYFKINFHDEFSYYEDPTVNGSVSGVTRFGGFENTAGAEGTWDLNDVVLSVGYDHYNFIPSTTQYEYTAHSSDFFNSRVSARVHPGVLLGIEASAGPTKYDQPVLQNNTTYSLGAYLQWQLTDAISTELHSGYFWYDFAAVGPIPAAKETGYYFSWNYKQRIRKHMSGALQAGRQTSLGIYSALTQQWYGQAELDFQPIRQVTVTAYTRYETTTQPIFLQYSDNYDRINLGLEVSARLNERWTASINYRYWIKNSSLLTFEDYEQNRITIQLAYKF